MFPFRYHRATSLADAEAALGADGEAMLLAGGMTLLPTMKLRLARPSTLIDLNGLDDLRYVRRHGDGLEIGALTTHAEIVGDPQVAEWLPALGRLARRIGDPQVRNRGTLGGSLANSDPAADYPAALLACDATIVTSRREIAAADYFVDLFETALEPGEIVTAVRFPAIDAAAYEKFAHPASRYALVGVMVARVGGSPRVAVTGAGPCAFRHAASESALAGDFRPGVLADVPVDSSGFAADAQASAEYRAQLLRVLAARAVATMVDGDPAA